MMKGSPDEIVELVSASCIEEMVAIAQRVVVTLAIVIAPSLAILTLTTPICFPCGKSTI